MILVVAYCAEAMALMLSRVSFLCSLLCEITRGEDKNAMDLEKGINRDAVLSLVFLRVVWYDIFVQFENCLSFCPVTLRL